jgi:hypothetical protein
MTNLNVPGLDLPAYMREVGERARAARASQRASTSAKDDALLAISRAIRRDEAPSPGSERATSPQPGQPAATPRLSTG